MGVFSLLKFWRNAGVGDPLNSNNFDITDDEGSFFDLVFTNPNNLDDQCVDSTAVNIISDFHSNHYQQQQHFSKLDGVDTKSKSNHTYYSSSPHSIFFNNSKILPLDSSSSSSTTKTPKSPFRVLKLGFENNKMKFEKKEMKCDIKESLLKRDNSLRKSDKLLEISSKRFVYKYLNIINPLYDRSSKRYNDKVRLPEHSPFPSSPATTSIFSPRKYLGKSRSSAAVKPVPLPALRRDDSALQQQDGIQSAILHCKKSYSSPSQGCYVLSRSGSAPSHGPRISVDEEKRSSI